MTKHWSDSDFVVTITTPAYDDTSTVNRFGYCRKCLCDMQSFGGNGTLGSVKHYASHEKAKRLGLWGSRKSVN